LSGLAAFVQLAFCGSQLVVHVFPRSVERSVARNPLLAYRGESETEEHGTPPELEKSRSSVLTAANRVEFVPLIAETVLEVEQGSPK